MSASEVKHPHIAIRPDWLALHTEEILEPDLPIIDPHHHLWDKPDARYLFDDLLADLACGHNIRATLFEQCEAMYREGGDPALRSLGETEFVNGVAAMSASGKYGPARACAGIIGHVDLRQGARARELLQMHITVSSGRFRGIRNSSVWHADPTARGSTVQIERGLLQKPEFRTGFAALAPLGLVFDAWMYHTQLDELDELAGAFPDTSIVMVHCGGPLGIGPYAGKRDEVFAAWRASIAKIAAHKNVSVKVGGLGMRMSGFAFGEKPQPPSSEELAAAWGPYVLACIEEFGPERCMFESNFPVDKGTCSYGVLWNTLKRIVGDFSPAEKLALFSGTASRVYGVEIS